MEKPNHRREPPRAESTGGLPLPRQCAFIPALLWYLLIWRFSSQTATVSGQLSDRLLWRLLEWCSAVFRGFDEERQYAVVEALSFWMRKAAHMVLFFVLAGLLLWALGKFVRRPGRRAMATGVLCALGAIADEYHQTFVPGRSGEWRDVLVDLSGAALLLALWALFRFLRRKFAKKEKLL